MSGFFKLEAGLGLIPSEDSVSKYHLSAIPRIQWSFRLSAIQAFSDSICRYGYFCSGIILTK